jgi:hypothetical protein
VRVAGDGDLVGVLRVHARRDDPTVADPPPSAVEVAAWERMMSTADLTVYVAELGGAGVGTASWARHR